MTTILYDYKRKYLPKGAGGQSTLDAVLLEPHASTRTRLHELKHVKAGHTFKSVEHIPSNAQEISNMEIEAELWAWQMTDKKATARVAIPAIIALQMMSVNRERIPKIIRRSLVERGIEPDMTLLKRYLRYL